MNESAIRAKIQAIDKTLSELQGQLERGFIDLGRYSRLKTDWERQKAELEAQLAGAASPGTATSDQALSAALRNILWNHFDVEELRNLCFFELNIDYDSLPGEGRGGKIRGLIAHCERFGRSQELLQACQRLRPSAFG